MSTKRLAAAFGKGLLAGLLGTLAITLSQMIEAKIRQRPPSDSPAEAAGKVLGVEPTGDEEKKRFSMIVHFGYGTAWGGLRGILAALGLSGTEATAVHFAAITTASMLVPPGLKVSPPVSEWGAEEIGVNTFHHMVYAVATGAVYEKLELEQ